MKALRAIPIETATRPPDYATTLVYARVSTKKQAGEDKTSIADQVAACTERARELGRTVDFVWADEGISGGKESRLDRLVGWCEAHPRSKRNAGLIVIWNSSRWGRFSDSADAAAFYRHRLHLVGWSVEYAQEPSTGDLVIDGTIRSFRDGLSGKYVVDLANDVQRKMKDRAMKGWQQGRPPFGYDRAAVCTADPSKRRVLAPYERCAHEGYHVELVKGDPADVRTVQRIFAWFAEGRSLTWIATQLNKEGAQGPWSRYNRGRKFEEPDKNGILREALPDEWKPFSNVDKILKCESYIGRRVFRPDDLSKYRRRSTVDPAAWESYRGAERNGCSARGWRRVTPA